MVLSNLETEQIAEYVIAGFTAGEKRPAASIDIIRLATRYLRLPIRQEVFAGPDANSKGYLSDGIWRLCVLRNGSLQAIAFPANTIVINSSVHPDMTAPGARFTVAHEAAHYLLELYRIGEIDIDPRYPGRLRECAAYENGQKTFNENRVDRLAATLLMPASVVTRHYQAVFGDDTVRVYGDSRLKPEDAKKIKTMGQRMGVSFSALCIRLRDMHFFDYRPLEAYTEGNSFPDDASDADIQYDKRRFHIPPETARRIHAWQREFQGLETKMVTCEICGTPFMETESDNTSFSKLKCQKCKYVGPVSAAFFRRIKPYRAIKLFGRPAEPVQAAR